MNFEINLRPLFASLMVCCVILYSQNLWAQTEAAQPEGTINVAQRLERLNDKAHAAIVAGNNELGWSLFEQTSQTTDIKHQATAFEVIRGLRGLVTSRFTIALDPALLSLIDRGVELAEEFDLPTEAASLLSTRVTMLQALQRYEDALQTIALIRADYADYVVAGSSTDMTLHQVQVASLLGTGKLDSAKSYLETILQNNEPLSEIKDENFKSAQRILGSLIEIRGAIAIYEGRYNQALMWLEKARTYYLNDPIKDREARSLANLENTYASVLHIQGKYEEALTHRLKLRATAARVYERTNFVSRILESNILAGYVETGNALLAQKTFEKILETEAQAGILALSRATSETEQDRTLAGNILASAFELAVLNGEVNESDGDRILAAIDHYLSIKARSTFVRIQSGRLNHDVIAPLLSKYKQAEAKHRELIAASDQVSRAQRDQLAAELRYLTEQIGAQLKDGSGFAPKSLASLRMELRDNEVLLGVFPIQDWTYVLALTKDELDISIKPLSASSMCVMVQDLRKTIGIDDQLNCLSGLAAPSPYPQGTEDIKGPEASIGDTILSDFEGILEGKSKLLVIAGGATAALPFAAIEGADDKVLAERFQITRLLTPSSLNSTHKLRSDVSLSYLGIGAPCAAWLPPPACYPATIVPNAKLTRQITDDSVFLPALPGALRELREASNVIGQDARLIVGEAVQLEQITQALLNPVDVLHFATHTLKAGPGRPEPALLLGYTDRGTGQPTVRVLDASSLAQMPLSGGLIILSACSTASDSRDDQTGTVSGFINAFAVAGARDVLVTHGRVGDQAISKLIPQILNLYRYNGGDLSAALAQIIAQHPELPERFMLQHIKIR